MKRYNILYTYFISDSRIFMKVRNIYIFENVKLFYSKKYVTSESNSQCCRCLLCSLVFEWKRGLTYFFLLTVEVFELKQSCYGKIGDIVSLDPRLSSTLSDERNP